MSTPITSSFSIQALQDIPFISELGENVSKNLQGSFVEEAILRNKGALPQTISYRDNGSLFLADGPETVAEGAEIPVSHGIEGTEKFSKAEKTAVGIEFTYEMLATGKAEGLIADSITRAQNSFVRKTAKKLASELKGLEGVNTVAASKKWEANDSNPVLDFRAAKRAVADGGAKEDKEFYGYTPDTLLISTGALEAAFSSEAMQRLYVGNIAGENPLYKGTLEQSIAGLKIVTSSFIADEDIYVLDSASAGFYGDFIPLTITDLYSPNGDSSLGGSRMVYRADIVRARHIAFDNVKAIAKITGAF